MKFHPCGHKVEMARRPYSTRVRPFKDSDVEVGIRWLPAHPDSPTLPIPSFVNSRDWLEDQLTDPPLGEVYLFPRRFINFRGTLPKATGHICGTADMFANGQDYDPAQNTVYNDDGLPVCCTGAVAGRVMEEGGPAAVWRTPRAYRGRVMNENGTRAVRSRRPTWTGRVANEDGPYSVRRRVPSWVGRVMNEDWPRIGEDVIRGAGVPNPGEDYCELQGPLVVNQWYLDSAYTPNSMGWGWFLEPGFYCFQARSYFTSTLGDVELFFGPDCGEINPIPIATTQVGAGGLWTAVGEWVDFQYGAPIYWFKTVVVTERSFLFCRLQPDDLSTQLYVKVTKDAICPSPPVLVLETIGIA